MIQRTFRQGRSRRPRRHSMRRGAALVEFAIASPVVFFLFLGMIEITRFQVVRHSLDQAVYAGARVGIVPGASADDVQTSVADRLVMAGISNPTITITPATLTSTTETVQVRASVSYAENSWTLPKIFSDQQVVAQITLDHENQATLP